MKTIISQFKDNIQRIRNLHSIYAHLSVSTTNIIDMSDILRAELAFAVSAFDHYTHGIVRIGMLEIFNGKRSETPSFKKFNIPLEKIKDAISNPVSFNWLEYEIIDQHSRKSFQKSDNVSEAIRLISDIKIWDEIAKRQGKNASDLKDQLDLIVTRRNQIVHEADMVPSSPGDRWLIDEIMVNGAIDFIEKLADTIYDILK
ncbi:MAG: HEPN domain-containing protein [Candidatus Poribacteria bacterium]